LLETWKERRNVLIQFQLELDERFLDRDYNIFIFGSFVRADFKPGQSDIDLIVYCNDMLKRIELAEYCEEYFHSIGIKADVLEYYFMPEAYIYAVGILNSVQMTDYYPQELKDELYHITKKYHIFLEEQRVKEKYMRWAYQIRKAKLMEKKTEVV
jgi:predicted nucleotidyltransferase